MLDDAGVITRLPLYYFGCRTGEAGHYLFDENFRTLRGSNNPFSSSLSSALDGAFVPDIRFGHPPVVLGSRVGAWTIASWVDNSVDTRPGSHSTFIGRGYSTASQLMEDARRRFPAVFTRPRQVVPVAVEDSATSWSIQVERLVWNLAGCDTIASGWGKPFDYDKKAALPALDTVSRMATQLAAARAFADRVIAVSNSPEFKSVFTVASIHHAGYNGQTWEQERQAYELTLVPQQEQREQEPPAPTPPSPSAPPSAS